MQKQTIVITLYILCRSTVYLMVVWFSVVLVNLLGYDLRLEEGIFMRITIGLDH